MTIGALNTFSQGLFQNGSNKGSTKRANPLIEVLKKLDPKKADDLQKKLEESQDLIKRLESSRQDISEQRKAAAAEKVAQIKAKLEALRLLAAVNPKAAARLAKQLARELKQALQEYASAGGGGSAALQHGPSIATGPAAAAQGDATATAGTANTVIADTETNTAGQIPPASRSTAQPPQIAGSSENPNGAQFEGVQTANTEAPPPSPIDAARKNEEEGQEALRAQIQEQVATIKESFAGSQADRDFTAAAKEVKTALKNIIELIKKRLQQEEDPLAEQDIKDAEKALRAVDNSLSEITSAVTAGPTGIVNILV